MYGSKCTDGLYYGVKEQSKLCLKCIIIDYDQIFMFLSTTAPRPHINILPATSKMSEPTSVSCSIDKDSRSTITYEIFIDGISHRRSDTSTYVIDYTSLTDLGNYSCKVEIDGQESVESVKVPLKRN